MRRFLLTLGVLFLIGAFFFLPQSFVFAETTAYRSASTITTDGNPPYTNLANCSVTDGNTCDRAQNISFANLYFRDFGDFGIPNSSILTHVRIRVTGKSDVAPYVGVSPGTTYSSNCQFISDLWTMGALMSETITTYNVTTPLSNGSLAFCLSLENIRSNNFVWRINRAGVPSWHANIDNFEIAFDYEPPPAPSKTPLLLIPGIGGSELRTTQVTPWSADDGHGGIFAYVYDEETVWVNSGQAAWPGHDDYFDILRMKSDGIKPEADLELTGDLFSGIYQPTIEFFIANGYELNETLFVFPYDWRRDIMHTTPLLDEKIEEIKQETGTEKVDIVAHSMGALVARNYIADVERASKIEKLFVLGGPHLGSVEFLKVLIYGGCLTDPRLPEEPLCIGVSLSEVKDVIQNMVGGYQLMPTQRYYDFYSGNNNLYPSPFSDLSDIDNNGVIGVLNYSQLKILLSNLDHNTSLFDPTELFHALDNSLENTNGVEVLNIVGSGIPTLGQVIETNAFDLLGVKIPKKDEISINGDGTVPLLSASLVDPDREISFLGDAQVFYVKQDHGNLVSPGPALNLVKNLLEDNSEIPQGVSTNPFSFSGSILSVHSPVNIHVYDSEGRHTGPIDSGDFEVNIPGSTYDTLDDAKFIWIPDEGQYSIHFEANGQGSFDFKIRKFEESENIETILYKDVPLTYETKAETTLDTNSTLPPLLEIDENNDGTADFQVERFSIVSGDENADYTPPVLSLDVTPKTLWPPNNKMVDVSITGTLTDDHPYLLRIVVDDEYDEVEPEITTEYQTEINQTLELKASRGGNDKDGRTYTIKIFAYDVAGNSSYATYDVLVPHDQGKKK